ncbi:MAG: hypothetical protein BWY74_00084 [Firmicutes bacterium ADurb.Bin419]|nr:MAG: hypothetical protein BWY74_00084 [Firmicutes bacterium ADurb.Bin419]
MESKYKKLIKCVVLDAIGMVSAAMPIIDVVWAPLAASISYKMFGDKRGKFTSVITFIEEILPVTDVIPSFTIFWFLFDFLQVGKDANTVNQPIDADFVEIK